MPDSVPLSRATTLIPFLKFLDELGAPVDRALEQGHLPHHLREMPGCFVATKLNWDFVGRMARQEDIDDLGLRVGYEAGVSLLGRSLFTRLSRSRNLDRGIADLLPERVARKHRHALLGHGRRNRGRAPPQKDLWPENATAIAKPNGWGS